MSTIPNYSRIISCIYDEPSPIGRLGRGTHYSIMRCVEWLDVMREPLAQAYLHDFAVIWDEDHDTRVIEAIERIYIAGLLSPVQFIGEKKGNLSVIVDTRFAYGVSVEATKEYHHRITHIAGLGEDWWGAEIGTFNQQTESPARSNYIGIIAASDCRVNTYLRNIDSLWSLGNKEFDLKEVPLAQPNPKISK